MMKIKTISIFLNFRVLVDEEDEFTDIKIDKKNISKISQVKNQSEGMNFGNAPKKVEQNNFFDPFGLDSGTTNIINNDKQNTNIIDIMGMGSLGNQGTGLDFFNMAPTSNNQNNQSNNMGGLFDNIISMSNPIQSKPVEVNSGGGIDFGLFDTGNNNSFPSQNYQVNSNNKEIFRNTDIKIECFINKESESDLKINYFVSSICSIPLDNIKLTFLAPKNVTVKVLQTSAYALGPNQINGILKDIAISSSAQKIVLKLKITYNKAGSEVTENLTLSDFS